MRKVCTYVCCLGTGERSGAAAKRTLWSFNTTMPPFICRLCDEFFVHVATRCVFWPRCCSLLFCAWPWRTASVVPMMAGHAAMAVRIPRTMLLFTVLVTYKESKSNSTKIITRTNTSNYLRNITRYLVSCLNHCICTAVG